MKTTQNSFTELILNRLKRNKDCIIFIVGQTGEGKSYAGLRIYENIAKALHRKIKFKNITFNAIQFLERIREYSRQRAKYEVILFDEAGVGLLSRRAMVNLNVLVGTVAQSFRYMLGVVIITAPEMGFVDSQVRGLTHYVLRTQSVNLKKKYSQFKVYLVEKNPIYSKIYYKRPILKGNKKLSMVRFNIPSKEIVDKYEEIKEESFKKYYGGVYARAKREEKDKYGLTPLQEEVYKLRNQGMSCKEIAKKLNKPTTTIGSAISLASRKVGKVV